MLPSDSNAPIRPQAGITLRDKAVLKLLVGVAAGIGAGLYAYRRAQSGHTLGPHEAIALALPGVLALAGLLELITGAPLRNLADKWEALKGWQRGVLGTSIVAVVFLVVIVAVTLWASKQ